MQSHVIIACKQNLIKVILLYKISISYFKFYYLSSTVVNYKIKNEYEILFQYFGCVWFNMPKFII